MRNNRFIHFLWVICLLTFPISSLAQSEEFKRDKSSATRENGEIDPKTGVYHSDQDFAWKAGEAARQAERYNELKLKALGISPSSEKAVLEEWKALDGWNSAFSAETISRLRDRSEVTSQNGGSHGVLILRWSVDAGGQYWVSQRRSELSKYPLPGKLNLGAGKDFSTIEPYVARAGRIILEGTFPNTHSWHQWLTSKCKHCVLSSSHSVNSTISEKLFAASLAAQVPQAGGIAAYNALPFETDFFASQQERFRMGIKGKKADWQQINREISQALDPGSQAHTNIQSGVADRKRILDDLQSGNRNVLLIFAHSDGTRIYMPGRSGGSISVKDLQEIRRKDAPDRVVVLIACQAGQMNLSARSIAEALLENKLAATVLAYPGLIDPNVLPQMINKIRAGVSLRDTFVGLYQIVNLPGHQYEPGSKILLRPRLYKRGFDCARFGRAFLPWRSPSSVSWQKVIYGPRMGFV